MSSHKVVNPALLPAPRGFSHGVLATGGRTLFVAGQIGCDANGVVVASDLVMQFERALENIMAVVREAGGTPLSVTRLNIYVTDVLEYRGRLKGLGQAWQRVMGKHYPAVSLLEVKSLFDRGARIELEATAVV
jgi:enamine deaminase RidA (YjgF/YER057c/UK114 family)